MGCCGIREIGLLSHYESPEQAFRALSKLVWLRTVASATGQTVVPGPDVRFRYIIFSQAREAATYGTRFAQFILAQKLARDLKEIGFYTNPNTGNALKTWIWAVDHDACLGWLKKDDLTDKYLKSIGL